MCSAHGGRQTHVHAWSKSVSSIISKPEITALHHIGKWEKQWVFYRCQVNGVVYQCEKYKRVTARNNFCFIQHEWYTNIWLYN